MVDTPSKNLDIEKDSRKRSSFLRILLLIPIFPLLVIISIWYYEETGRYVSTENAYVKADIIQISPKISGTVGKVKVKNHQSVKAGEVLFYLDHIKFSIALDAAKAELASAKFGVDELKSNYRLLGVRLKEAQERVKLNQLKYERKKKLSLKKIGPRASLEEAKYNLEAAKQFSAGLIEQQERVLQNLQGDPNLKYAMHPSVKKARAIVAQKYVDLNYTKIVAPSDGIVANLSLQEGEFVSTGKPVFSIVKQENMWVEANLKETQLTHLKPGQTAEIFVDAFPDLTWSSKIARIGAATGAEFSLLPPQNASGNWVKVVQRLPVRLSFLKKIESPILRPGMSVKVVIDTKHNRSALKLARQAFASLINKQSLQLQSIIE